MGEATVDVFCDMVCPFTHVGLRRLRDLLRQRDIQLTLRCWAWPLELINGQPLAADLLSVEVDALKAQVAPDLFAGYDPSLLPLSSLLAFGLVEAAYQIDAAVGAAVSFAVRDSFFEQGQDISNPGILRTLGERFGVMLPDRDTAEQWTRDSWHAGIARGVVGSPHFFVGDRDWFCPSLNISHEHGRFDIHVAEATMRDFYQAITG